MTPLQKIRRLYWQYRFNRLSTKQLLDAYRPFLDYLVKRKIKAAEKLNGWPLGSIPSDLLTEVDLCNEEALHAIQRNDADCARHAIERASTYPQQLKQACQATDRLNEAKRQLEKLPKNSTSWVIANRVLTSADKLLRQRTDRNQKVPHEPAAKVSILSGIVGLLTSDPEPDERPAEMNLTLGDLEMLNQRLSMQLERFDILFPPDSH